MIPTLALVGRPNVGKSTLFNRISRTRSALVYHLPGVTKDRQYARATCDGQPFRLIDTAGWSELKKDETSLSAHMQSQLFAAIEEADAIAFVLNAREGIVPEDYEVLDRIRRSHKPFVCVVNKSDGVKEENLHQFYELGLDYYPVSAAHNSGVKSFLNDLLIQIPQGEEPKEPEAKGTKVAVFGRPNVGKSTLINRFIGKDQQIVFDQAGTTTDSVYVPFEKNDEHYVLIDTAGIRRRKNVSTALEKFSILKAFSAIEEADVGILVLDAGEGLLEQDIKLMRTAMELGRAMVIGLNKWDHLSSDAKNKALDSIDRRIRSNMPYEILPISAKFGTGVGSLLEKVSKAHQWASQEHSTSKLTRIMQDLTSYHTPPRGRRGMYPKIKLVHQAGIKPPTFVLRGNSLMNDLPESYLRYLAQGFRASLSLQSTPIRLVLQWEGNPYTHTPEGKAIHML